MRIALSLMYEVDAPTSDQKAEIADAIIRDEANRFARSLSDRLEAHGVGIADFRVHEKSEL